jgi:eukaryotic-like serine/threonine-protein kinase
VTWLSDTALARLRALDDRPDFSATRYTLGEPVGRGGTAVVFHGHDRELRRDVAIKITEWSTTADAERLRQEARTLAALEHPGIVPIHDVGQLADGRVFTVMMLVRGERLDAAAARLPPHDRLRLFDRICDTVSFAHARHVIHRDLKPANIMVGPFGQVLVLDWGLAAAGAAADAAPAAGGTDGYMPPEQRHGVSDARSDVFALGGILRDLAGDTSVRPLRPLHSIVARARQAEPEARYPDAASLAADVRRFVDGLAVTAHPESMVDRTRRLVRTYRTPIGLVLAYLVMRGLLLFWPA